MAGGAETFALELASVAPVEALLGWIEDAAPRSRVIYATGLALPSETDAVKLVQRWIEAGRVATFRQRDPIDSRRWRFIAEKCGVGVRGDDPETMPVSENASEAQLARQKKLALAELIAAARAQRPCPSNRELAEKLGLPRCVKGVRRARYVLDLLVAEGRIKVLTPEQFGTRQVTIEQGPWKGKVTA